MPFRCGIRMSFRQVRKPHMKKSIVAMLMARTSVLRAPECCVFVTVPAPMAIFWVTSVALQNGKKLSHRISSYTHGPARVWRRPSKAMRSSTPEHVLHLPRADRFALRPLYFDEHNQDPGPEPGCVASRFRTRNSGAYVCSTLTI